MVYIYCLGAHVAGNIAALAEVFTLLVPFSLLMSNAFGTSSCFLYYEMWI